MNALDQPSERCTIETRTPNTSGCIADFIEKQLGCSITIHSSGSSTMPPCNSSSQFKNLKEIQYKLAYSDANTIYKMTGCLAACQRYEYQRYGFRSRTSRPCHTAQCDYYLRFRISHGTEEERTQYYRYEFNSFIADVGGYMGLLLGFSMLSIYNEIDRLSGKIKAWFGEKITLVLKRS